MHNSLKYFKLFVINALLMSLVIVLFHKVKKFLGTFKGYLSLIFFWISMEYLHLNWELGWALVNIRKCICDFSKHRTMV